MLPCVIQEFDHPSALEPVATLPNLNALRLKGHCLGLLLPGPAVSTWEEAQGSGATPQSPRVDANCNRPEIEGWAWGWAWRGPEDSPSRQTSESCHPTSRRALETLHSPSSGTSGSTDSPSSGCSESPTSHSPGPSLYPGPTEIQIPPSLGDFPSSGSTESPDSPSPGPIPYPGPTESSDSPSPGPIPYPGPTESPDFPSPGPIPYPGPTESPDSPSMGPIPYPRPTESLASPSLESSLSPRSMELPTSPYLRDSLSRGPMESPTSPSPSPSPSPGPTELQSSPSLGDSLSPGPTEFPASPSLSTSSYPGPTELPSAPSLGDSPSPGPTKSPALPSLRAPISPGPQEFSTIPVPKTGPSEFPASSSSWPLDCQGFGPTARISGSLITPMQGFWGMDRASTSVDFVLSPELSGFLRCSPDPGTSEPLCPPSPLPGTLASNPETTPQGAELHTDPRIAGRGSNGARVTTFHELALRRRRPMASAPRPPPPPPAEGAPPPPVITFRELRWRGQVNGVGPREDGVEETSLPTDGPSSAAGSSGGRGMADGGAKPAREDPSLLRPVQSYLLCFSFPNPSYSHIEPPTTDDSRDPETGRPSPVGAYTPPQRGSLFLPSSPGHHSLCSPPFLRRWSFPPSYLAPVPYLPLGCPSPLGLFFSLASPSPDLPNPRDIHPPQSAGRSDRGSGVSGEGFSIWNTGMDRSPSTPCESSRKHRRMDEVTPAAAISSPCLETKGTTLNPMSKRGLVWAVSVAVDNVIAHFSAARNVVQKTQLGNSRDSPRLGHMLLASLCPALTAVLGDGLKVYRHDLVMGRRPNSPWTVVEISVKADHTPRHLYNVFHQLDGLSQLSNSQRKFNAFVFALLNLKLLDFWMASLQNYAGALKTLYTPSAFLCLSHSGVFEELLLLLQPLSALSFQLDPLFEYHHSPQASEMAKPGHTVLSADQLDRTWRQGDEELCAPTAGQTFPGSPAGVEEGYRLQETLDQVSSWAWRLGRAVLELGVDREAQSATRPSDVSVGWWGQLARSCQVDLLLPHRPSRGLGTGPWWGEVARAQYNPMPGAQRDSMVGAQHDLTAEAESNPTNGVQHNPMARAQGTPTDGAGLEDRPWDIPHSTGTPRLTLASLFGARIPSIHSPRHPEHSRSRLPSDWLQLNIINLWRAPSAKTARPLGTGEVKTQGGENRFSARMVRTLCDHQAVEDGQLDFRRGETLEVLGCFNDAWIRCRRGNTSGLVPIEYTSLV